MVGAVGSWRSLEGGCGVSVEGAGCAVGRGAGRGLRGRVRWRGRRRRVWRAAGSLRPRALRREHAMRAISQCTRRARDHSRAHVRASDVTTLKPYVPPNCS